MASGIVLAGNPQNIPNLNNYSSFNIGGATPLNLVAYQQHYAQAGHSEQGAGSPSNPILVDSANPNWTGANIVAGGGSVSSGNILFNVLVAGLNLETDTTHTIESTSLPPVNAVGFGFVTERNQSQQNQIASNTNSGSETWDVYQNGAVVATGVGTQGSTFSAVRTPNAFEFYYGGALVHSYPRTVTYAISSSPIGTLSNTSSQNVSGNGVTFTPNGTSGSAIITATFQDGDVAYYFITVAGALPNGTVGTPYIGNPVQSAGGVAPYTYSVCVGNLPTGTTINASTGQITGTPTVNGTYNFTVCQVDANGVTLQQTPYTIVVGGGATNPVFSTVCPQNLVANQNATLTVDVPSNWTASVAGGSFAPSNLNQTGVTYTPPVGYVGTITITATNASDATKSTTCNLVYSAIVVVVPPPSTTVDVGNSACNVIEVGAATQNVNIALNPANVGTCGNNTIWLKRTDCSAFSLFVTTVTGTIDGASNIQLDCREAVLLYWNGSRWLALADYTNLS